MGARYPAFAALCLGAALFFSSSARAQPIPVTAFAAASLKSALEPIARDFAREAGRPLPRLSFAATPALARQIEQGAPADLFFSADVVWMDHLQARGLIRPDSRRDLLGNRLALVAARGAAVSVAIERPGDLLRALGDGRLAVAETTAVPAGRYARAALVSLGIWDDVKSRLAQSENVRAALLFVSRGEAPLGVVYATDALAEPSVRVVADFPPESHPPIVYPVAVTAASRHPDAALFLAFLDSETARARFAREGFLTLLQGR